MHRVLLPLHCCLVRSCPPGRRAIGRAMVWRLATMMNCPCRAPNETVPARLSTWSPRSLVRGESLEWFDRKVDSLRSMEEAAENRRETTRVEMRLRAPSRAFWWSSLQAQEFRQKPPTATAASD